MLLRYLRMKLSWQSFETIKSYLIFDLEVMNHLIDSIKQIHKNHRSNVTILVNILINGSSVTTQP